MSRQQASHESFVVGEAFLEAIRAVVRQEIQTVMVEVGRETNVEPQPYLTVAEAAETARIAKSTIRLYIRKGELNALKVGRRLVIPRSELERFLSLNPTGVVVH